ncbi:MAG: hypothetical protein IJM30_11570 [Thermoguttaceae bacterium]|nr:hypothetical protein [Thermoguttaceae bacterium]
MICPDCGYPFASEDEPCAKCGRLPVRAVRKKDDLDSKERVGFRSQLIKATIMDVVLGAVTCVFASEFLGEIPIAGTLVLVQYFVCAAVWWTLYARGFHIAAYNSVVVAFVLWAGIGAFLIFGTELPARLGLLHFAPLFVVASAELPFRDSWNSLSDWWWS